MHTPLLLPAGPAVGEKLVATMHQRCSKMLWLSGKYGKFAATHCCSNVQRWVVSVHKGDKHVHGFSLLKHGV